ncbi:MAG: hypothetical protein ABMB14_17900, partial [Myxococcota bacterium]
VYRTAYSVGGAYLTARLAPDRPLAHALVLGVVGTGLATAGWLATRGMDLGPGWYPIALIALSIPQCWAGGALAVRPR